MWGGIRKGGRAQGGDKEREAGGRCLRTNMGRRARGRVRVREVTCDVGYKYLFAQRSIETRQVREVLSR